MEILVCVKQTFDTEETIQVEHGKIVEEDIERVINPYDEYAIEEAVRLKEKLGGKITVLSIGKEETDQAIRRALAMGADEGVWVNVDDWDGEIDEHTVTELLVAAIEEEDLSYDLILCGYMAVDDGSAQVGARLADRLDLPHISTIVALEVDGDVVRVQKDVEGDIEHLEARLPILLTAQQGLNDPRYPSLPGIMKAKRKPLVELDLEDLELDEKEFGAKTEVKQVFLPPSKGQGEILTGDLSEQVKELVQRLQSEAKVIEGRNQG